jgi:hypothetical protein
MSGCYLVDIFSGRKHQASTSTGFRNHHGSVVKQLFKLDVDLYLSLLVISSSGIVALELNAGMCDVDGGSVVLDVKGYSPTSCIFSCDGSGRVGTQ